MVTFSHKLVVCYHRVIPLFRYFVNLRVYKFSAVYIYKRLGNLRKGDCEDPQLGCRVNEQEEGEEEYIYKTFLCNRTV